MLFGLQFTIAELLFPVLGIFFTLLVPRSENKTIKNVLLYTTFCSFLLSVVCAYIYRYVPNMEYIKPITLLKERFIPITFAVDHLSSVFVPVICLMTLLSTLWIYKEDLRFSKTFSIAILLFQVLSIGAFYVCNIFLMFMLIEATIIPIYILMLNRKRFTSDAIFHYLLYTMLSAMLILIALIQIYFETKTTNIYEICEIGISNKNVLWLLLIGIAIKMPMWPCYHWLPIVHGKTQTVCSVMLASVVLKFASLLILRFVEPLFADQLLMYRPEILVVLLVSIISAIMQVVFQKNLKQLFSYFSIIHLNFFFFIILSQIGTKYFIYSLVTHSMLMPLMFFTSSMIKKIYGTDSIEDLRKHKVKHLHNRFIILVSFLMLMSVPFSGSMISEVLAIYSGLQISMPMTITISLVLLASYIYITYIYCSCFSFSKVSTNSISRYKLDTQKLVAFVILIVVNILLGIVPSIILI